MDIQKLARNQLDGILRAAASISGINYEQRIEELEKKNADLVALLKAVDDIMGDVYDMVDEDKFNAVWKQVSALAQVDGE